MRKEKVAILGGGVGALITAWELTENTHVFWLSTGRSGSSNRATGHRVR